MNEPMTESLKTQIVLDSLQNGKGKLNTGESCDFTRYIMRLVRALDSYRERDEKGRFIKTERS